MNSHIFRNPYDSAVKNAVQENRQNALHNKVTTLFAHKKFFERWHLFSTGCTVLTYLCNLFSPITAMMVVFFVMFDSFAPIMGDAMGGAVAIMMAMVAVEQTKAITKAIFIFR